MILINGDKAWNGDNLKVGTICCSSIKKRKLERPETNIFQIHDNGVQDENIEEQNTQEIPTQQKSYKMLEIGVQSVQDQSADKKIIQEYNLLGK